jgi:hypothetical protein
MNPFNITISIEGMPEQLYIVPEITGKKTTEYKVFDNKTYIGTVWADFNEQGRFWCAEGAMARELLAQIGQQIELSMPM